MISSLGEDAIAAVGIFLQPKMTILIFVRSFAVAITQVTALWCVSEKVKLLSAFLKQCTFFTCMVSLLLLLGTTIFMEELLYVAGAEDEYFDMALEYAYITNISLFFFSISVVLNAALTGLGSARAMLLANVTGNIVNIILNYFFIFTFEWGVKGAAIATLIGSLITLFVSFLFVNRKTSKIALRGFSDWIPEKEKIIAVKTTLISTIVEQTSERFGIFVYTVLVASLGVVSFSTHCICMLLCDTYYAFGQGFSKASLAVSANLVGKRKSSAISIFARTILPVCFVCGIAAAIFFYTMGETLVSFYSTDPAVIELGGSVLSILAISTFPMMLSLSYSGILRGIGYAKYVAKYSFWLVAVLRPFLTYFLMFTLGFGLHGAWAIVVIDQLLRTFFATYKFISKKKMPIPPGA